MSRQAVFAHRGNVPDVGNEKLSVKRLSWMGAHKTESVLVTFEDGNRVAQAEEARKQREKIMGNIRMQLHRINDMLESPQREKSQNGDDANNTSRSPASAMSTARSRQADPKQLVSYLDGTSHSRFSIANYNAYVRAKMTEIMEAHPPNSEWPLLPTDEDFPVPAISEGTGISPSNVTSAPTWRDMLGGRGTIGYNTKASACSKELMQYEYFQGVNFGEGFDDKATNAGPLKEEEQQPAAAEPQQQQEGSTARPEEQPAATTEEQPAVTTEEEQPKKEEEAAPTATAAAEEEAQEKKEEEQQPVAAAPSGEAKPFTPPPPRPKHVNPEEFKKQQEEKKQREEAAAAATAPTPAPAAAAPAEEEKKEETPAAPAATSAPAEDDEL